MTKRQALSKAVALFGKNATVTAKKCSPYERGPKKPPLCSGAPSHKFPCPGGLPVCMIGELVSAGPIPMRQIHGIGHTWEEAFENHAAHAKKYHEAAR